MKANREWISISDMMSGLMMVFLFIAILFVQKIEQEKNEIKDVNKVMVDIAETYAQIKVKLNEALHKEFDDDLEKWGAEILSDNTIRFKEPDVLFDRSEAVLKTQFKEILDDFIPRYLSILTDDIFVSDIVELRIEGHTSSEWRQSQSLEVSYLKNARLSQERAFTVLSYMLSLSSIEQHQEWLIKVLRANGLAFAKRIVVDGVEDFSKSRRVEFRVVTNTENRIEAIINKSKNFAQ